MKAGSVPWENGFSVTCSNVISIQTRPDLPQLKSTDASVLLKILRDFPLASAQVLSPWCPVPPLVIYPLISVCPQNILLLNLAEIMEYSSPLSCLAYLLLSLQQSPLTLFLLRMSLDVTRFVFILYCSASHSSLRKVSGSTPYLHYFILSPGLFFNGVSAGVDEELKNDSFEPREVSWNTSRNTRKTTKSINTSKTKLSIHVPRKSKWQAENQSKR